MMKKMIAVVIMLALSMLGAGTVGKAYAQYDGSVTEVSQVAPNYTAGESVEVTVTIIYTGTLPRLDFQVNNLPTGLTYQGKSSVFLSWDTVPSSPFQFTYTLDVAAGTTGEQKVIGAAFVLGSPTSSELTLYEKVAVPTIPTTEREALIALYNSTGGDSWTEKDGWKQEPLHTDGFAMPGTECTWKGITCYEYHVKEINLTNNGLNGTIPVDLGKLSALEVLNLSYNKTEDGSRGVSGLIPDFSSLTKLTSLDLSGNLLSGEILESLGNLTNLNLLALSENQLTGSIPDFSSLTKLTSLVLSGNSLSGGIPATLGSLSALTYLELYSNQLSGSIPPELGRLSNLTYLYLHSNELSGNIPPELGSLSNLKHLHLYSNQLSGSIPPELGSLSNLTYLYLHSNELSGNIPPELGSLSNLKHLHLYSNQLSGSIPSELANLKSLTDGESDFCNNKLYTTDQALRNFLNTKQVGGDWESCQTLLPNVSLTTDNPPLTINENNGTGIVKIVLDKAATADVTVYLSFSGTATAETDYTVSGTSVTITQGNTEGIITLTGISDTQSESDETVKVSIASVTGAVAGTAEIEAIIKDEFKAFYIINAYVIEGVGDGTIEPFGDVKVNEGESKTFTFTPNASYAIGEVKVDESVVNVTDNQYTFENVTAGHSISVTFKRIQHKITATAGDGGGIVAPYGDYSVSQQATIMVNEGEDQQVTFKPADGYEVDTVTVDDTAVEPANPYTFENVSVDHSISVTFKQSEKTQYKITATAGENGTIDPPAGEIMVYEGESQTFTFTPNTGYEIEAVTVDGSPVTVPENSYTFSNVTADRSIYVTFRQTAKPQYRITATAGANGSISPAGEITVNEGDSRIFTFTPNTGYEIEAVTVDGSPVTVTENSYTFSNVTADRSIYVTFRAIEHVITASAGEGGEISPAGEVIVKQGEDQKFVFLPDEGYEVDSLIVDRESQEPASEYTFTAVTASHSIEVTFKLSPKPQYKITVSAGANGMAEPAGDPPGEVLVIDGAEQTFTFKPAEGYEVDTVTVDDKVFSAISEYSFENVVADHTLSVTFKRIEHVITASAGANGKIEQSGEITAEEGSTHSFSFIPDDGYEVNTVTVDGSAVEPASYYIFKNVSADHSIHVTFKALQYVITASAAGSGGSISPSGDVVAAYGETKTFSILPLEGYKIQDVLVDGKSVGNVSSYIFSNVVENHTISAVFVKKPESVYTIIADAGVNGSIYPSGYISVQEGGTQSFSMYPASGYKIESVTVDGIYLGAIDTYTFANVSGSHTIFVSFAPVLVPKIAVFEGGNSVPNGGSVNFGETFAGTQLTKSFIIKNTGTDVLTLSYSLAPENFTLLGEIPESIEAGAETSFQIQFKAENVGNFKGTLKFDSNDTGNTPYNLALSAAVTVIPEPEIEVLWNDSLISNNGSFSFDGTTKGTPITKTFVVRNTGTAELKLGMPQLPEGFTLVGAFPDSIDSAGSGSFQIRLDAEELGKFAGTLQFGNNDKDENPYRISLSGEVTPVPVPEIAVFSDSVEIPDNEGNVNFGDTLVGAQPATKIFTIQNTGTETLEIGKPELPSGFSIVGEFPQSIEPDKSADVEIQLDTDVVGKFTGTLLFETNDSDENPYDFTLTGFISEHPNNPPEKPVAVSPANETALPEGEITLEASDFSDPDGDAHEKTYWEIKQSDGVVNTEMTTQNLEAMSHSDFASGLKYLWKVQYEDERGGVSDWSEERSFKVGVSEYIKGIEVGPGAVTADFRMVSFVHLPDNPAPEQIFGVGDYDTTLFRIGTYNPAKGGYDEYGSGLGNVEPGKAYWVFSRNKHTIQFSGIPVSKNHEIEIPLSYNPDVEKGGWNMVACPNDADYDWNEVQVLQYDDNGKIVKVPVSVKENDLVEKKLWEWKNGNYNYDYDISTMVRNEGYWVKVKQKNVFLKFPISARIEGNQDHSRQAASRYDDSPPAPISSFTGGTESRINEGGGGCFIDSLF